MAELIVSNIAWTNNEEYDIAKKLQQLGIKKVEIAPTKHWDDPTMATTQEIQEYIDWWEQFDIEIAAFQSMLFVRPDLKIFETEELRKETGDYLAKFLYLAGNMGVNRLVFGSPKNRQRNELNIEQADEIAIELFASLGEVAIANNTMLCIEPNAQQYGCDYITNAAEGAAFVRRVASRGIGLHLDTACMALAGDDIEASIQDNADILDHFHVSAPMLEQVEDRQDVDYRAAARALKEIGYSKLISIEMRPGDEGTNIERVEKAVTFARSIFTLQS